jgi:2'-5' RNA ligase
MGDENIWPDYYDIVILPPPSVQRLAIDLSRRLQPYGGKFVLGERRFIPHISLYHVPVRPERFADFSEAVRAVASRRPGGALELRFIEMPVIMTDKPAWLAELHLDMVRETVRFLDRGYNVEETWHTGYLPTELQAPAARYLKEYGSPLIDEVFRPHITLTSFGDKGAARSIPAPEFERLSFVARTVTICELGPSHSCQRIVATHDLGKPLIINH